MLGITSIKIGIFYKDIEWKKNIYAKLKKQAMDCLSLYSLGENMICYRDHYLTIEIHFVYANESNRGHRFDKVYYQEGISDDIKAQVIFPAYMSRPHIIPDDVGREERNG